MLKNSNILHIQRLIKHRVNIIRTEYSNNISIEKTIKKITLISLVLLCIISQVKGQTDMKINKERIIQATPSVVWDVLTNPTYIEKWLGVKAESSWEENAPILFKFSWDGKEFIDKGEIIELEKNRVFAYTYWSNFSGLPDEQKNYSKIRFDLDVTENSKRTKLVLTHSDFANETMYKHSDENWEETLNEIKKIAESEFQEE